MYVNAIVIFISKKDFKNTNYNHTTEDDDRNIFELFYYKNSIYNDSNKFMVSWWVIYSYFNIEQIQIGDIEIMISAYGSPGSFGSRVRSKSIVNNTYTGRRSNFHSKPTTFHEPFHKYDFNCPHSRSNFSRLPHLFAKNKFIVCLKIIDPVLNVFSPNYVSSYFHIYDHSIVTFGIREECIGFSKTSRVDSLDRFIRSVVNKVNCF